MSRIFELASEPFNEVISQLDTLEWTALWICGDKRMNWKLGKGKAVCKMVLEWPTFSRCPWPSQVIELAGLQSFSLFNERDAAKNVLSGLQLSTLSRHLEVLNLKSDSSLDAFHDLHSLHPGHFQRLERLSLKFRTRPVNLNFQLLLPQTLTDLELFRRSAAPKCNIPSPSLLPPSLKSLTLYGVEVELDGHSFPKNLKTFFYLAHSGPSESNSLQWALVFRFLPIGIERVTFRSRCGTLAEADRWSSLSKLINLKSLDVSVRGPFSIELAQMLPRSIEELHLAHIYTGLETWCVDLLKSKALPPRIRKMTGVCRGINTAVAQNLPETLELMGNPQIAPGIIPHLPNNISMVHVSSTGDLGNISSFPSNASEILLPHLTHSLAKRLPKGLKSLTIHHSLIGIPLEAFSILPTNLTALDTYWTPNPSTNIEGFLKVLPRTLTCLKLSVVGRTESEIFFPTPSQSSLHLPRCMEILEIGHMDFSGCSMADWILGLPRSLTLLGISVRDLQKDTFPAFGILPSLNTLKIEVENPPEDGWASKLDFKFLPRSLTEIRLKQTPSLQPHTMQPLHHSSDITNETFRGAPMRLKVLEIPKSPKINRGCLVHLPRILTIWEQPQIVPVWFSDEQFEMTQPSTISRFGRYVSSWFGTK
jgi:hypothetical protein